MSKSAPAPAKSSGAGIFIFAAIAMLVTTGGLLYWRLGGDEPVQPEQPAPAPSVAQTPPKFTAPPPPPPPEEKEEKEETKKVVQRKRPTGPKGCSATACTGDSPAVRSALRAVAGQARSCYERALRQNSMLSGKLLVSMRLSPSGAVCYASVAQNSLGDVSVGNCVVQKMRGAKYPAPKGGCMDTQVPLNFVPRSR